MTSEHKFPRHLLKETCKKYWIRFHTDSKKNKGILRIVVFEVKFKPCTVLRPVDTSQSWCSYLRDIQMHLSSLDEVPLSGMEVAMLPRRASWTVVRAGGGCLGSPTSPVENSGELSITVLWRERFTWNGSAPFQD